MLIGSIIAALLFVLFFFPTTLAMSLQEESSGLTTLTQILEQLRQIQSSNEATHSRLEALERQNASRELPTVGLPHDDEADYDSPSLGLQRRALQAATPGG